MVAVIKTGHSLSRILNYNENKVKEGSASAIYAANYPMDIEQLTFENKLRRLKNQAALNENVTRNSVHISLNFDPSESLSTSMLAQIADTYMDKIGYGQQPYLVYQHFDSGHPHIHIVSVKVREDGSRIDMQNIGRNQSEQARKEIEKNFNLVKASVKEQQASTLKPVNIQRVQYGRSETKRAITNVLELVVNGYRFTSLPELNAVLQQYNVYADKGTENSRIFKHHGLVYRILNEAGEKVGVPIKASDIFNKPTLSFLESRYEQNEKQRQQYKSRLTNTIDQTLLKHPSSSLIDLLINLKSQGVRAVLRQNKDGLIYGITYVDHRTKCVFNGSDLGKEYSARRIQERCQQPIEKSLQPNSQTIEVHSSGTTNFHSNVLAADPSPNETNKVINLLFQPKETIAYIPNALVNSGRKKKKKKNNSRHL